MVLRAGRTSFAWAAGDLMLNGPAYARALRGGRFVAPTRSGRTTEVLRVLETARADWSGSILGIVCAEGTPAAALCDLCLELPWAFDESVCQTRTVSNLYLAEMMVAGFLAGDDDLLRDLDQAIADGRALEARYADRLREVASRGWREAVVLSDGETAGLGEEGALAMLEIAGVAGRHYHVLDVRHGPMVTIDARTLVLVHRRNADPSAERKLVEEIVSRGATVVTYAAREIAPVPGVALAATSGRDLDPAAQGLPFIFLAQSLASGKADALGIDPDNPEGITAWVDLG
jgi:glucosamine--fructose-6-phosphate aminotransferase (isomerizing)